MQRSKKHNAKILEIVWTPEHFGFIHFFHFGLYFFMAIKVYIIMVKKNATLKKA